MTLAVIVVMIGVGVVGFVLALFGLAGAFCRVERRYAVVWAVWMFAGMAGVAGMLLTAVALGVH